jgi:hypothetical protein
MDPMPTFVHYIPIATTAVAAFFAAVVLRRYASKGGTHLLWWGIGMITYGVGTMTEALTTVLGWQEPVFRAWYITGALLGGAPLAQGTVYLLMKRATADRLTIVLVTAITVASVCVLLTPIDQSMVEPFRLSGRVMQWQWVRAFSPFINMYAAVFLIGGAIYSALKFRSIPTRRGKYVGNIFIAVGALLPGIGGTFTRFGHVEVLYVTEFVGLLLIFVGYRLNVQSAPAAAESPAAGLGLSTAR